MPNENFLFSYPKSFQNICLIYPPTNKDILAIEFDSFISYVSILTQSQEDLDELIEKNNLNLEITPFQFLFLKLSIPEYEAIVSKAFYFFLKEKPTFLFDRREIVVGPYNEKRLINEENFFDFQNLIRNCTGFEEIEDLSLLDPRLRAMKISQRKRDRIKNKQHPSNITYSSQIIGLCCYLNKIPSELESMSYAATVSLFNGYKLKDNAETNTAVMLAGGELSADDKESINWVEQINK